MAQLRIEFDDLFGPAVARLLEEHLAEMRAASPPESVHALDLAGLQAAEVTFWTVHDGEDLVGCGALKDLGGGRAEVKSMRTARGWQGRGVGAALLRHVLAHARRTGVRTLLLETGSQDHFAPARRLYARHGFAERGPFGSYVLDTASVFMSLELDADAPD